MIDETSGTEHLVASHRNERSRNLAMATSALDSRSAILHGLGRAKMAPLRMMPASDSGYELTTISEIFDGHTRKMHPNEYKLSYPTL